MNFEIKFRKFGIGQAQNLNCEDSHTLCGSAVHGRQGGYHCFNNNRFTIRQVARTPHESSACPSFKEPRNSSPNVHGPTGRTTRSTSVATLLPTSLTSTKLCIACVFLPFLFFLFCIACICLACICIGNLAIFTRFANVCQIFESSFSV